MAHRQLYVTDKGAGFYRTRMLSAGDPIVLSGPEARLQMRLGNVAAQRPRKVRVPVVADDLTELRAEYQRKLGKRAFNGWDAATLRAKMAEA